MNQPKNLDECHEIIKWQSEEIKNLQIKLKEQTSINERLKLRSDKLLANNTISNSFHTIHRGIVHDLHNFIAGLSRTFYTLEKESKLRGLNIDKQIHQIDFFIEKIVTLIRLSEPGKDKVESIELSQFIKNTIKLFENRYRKTKFHLSVSDNLNFNGKKNQIFQIIYNLINNSVKATEKKPRAEIILSCQRKSNFLEIKVKDNGNGIEEELFSQICEFGITTKKDGIGLGLYYIKSIVEDEYMGSMKIESTFRKGTTVTIQISDKK